MNAELNSGTATERPQLIQEVLEGAPANGVGEATTANGGARLGGRAGSFVKMRKGLMGSRRSSRSPIDRLTFVGSKDSNEALFRKTQNVSLIGSNQTLDASSGFEGTSEGNLNAFDVANPALPTTDPTMTSPFLSTANGGAEFILQPTATATATGVPEPETWTLLAMGLGSIGLVARMRRGAKHHLRALLRT